MLSTIAASWLAWRWMCDSPQTGCMWRRTSINVCEQEIIEWSQWSYQLMLATVVVGGWMWRPVEAKSDLMGIFVVACCHSVKLCALAAWAFRSQQQ